MEAKGGRTRHRAVRANSHSETVAELCALIAGAFGLATEHVAALRLAGLVHDVGKIGVPDAILQKPPALDDEAMTSDRPYRRGMSQHDAVDELRRHAGTRFDSACVDALLTGLRLAPDAAATPRQASG